MMTYKSLTELLSELLFKKNAATFDQEFVKKNKEIRKNKH